MENGGIIPKATMHRYPVYLKALRGLHARGIERIRSEQLSDLVNIKATTIRKDLSLIGCLGKQGFGYDIENLIEVFNQKFKTGFDEKIILIGVGNLGSALLNYNRWQFVVGEIVAAFDINPNIVGTIKQNVPIYHINDLEQNIPENCHMAILTASQNGQEIVDRLNKCGIIGVVDFTHQHITVPKGMLLKTLDIVSNIQEMVFEANTVRKITGR